MKMRGWHVLAALCLSIISACATHTKVTEQRPLERETPRQAFVRGLWVRAASVAVPESIPRVMRIVDSMDITDIFVQVVVGGYAYYDSELLPRSQYLSKVSEPDYDPLDSLIRSCSNVPVRIHAWVNALLWWSLSDPPDSMSHVFYTHPDWFINDANNRSMAEYPYDLWKNMRVEGMYLDPTRTDVSGLLQDVCAEITQRYPVDGIHLDFIRYPGITWGLDRTDQSAVFASIDAWAGNSTLVGYCRSDFRERWQAWQAWRLTRGRRWTIAGLVSAIGRRVQEESVKRPCLLSCAVFADPFFGRHSFAQDWTEWPQGAYVPVVMSYTPDITRFIMYAGFALRHRPDAILGIGMLWPSMRETARLQEQAAEKVHAAGVCYFDFANLDTMTAVLDPRNEKLDSIVLDTAARQGRTISDAFADRPPAELCARGVPLTAWGADIEFAAFMLSLSLNPERDLAQMGLSRAGFIETISQDVAAFLYLEEEIFPLGDVLIEPPCRAIRFSFLPRLDDDSLTVIRRADTITALDHEAVRYPDSPDPFTRAVFSARTGERETLITPAGVYVFTVEHTYDGGRHRSRRALTEDVLPVHMNWTIKTKMDSILGNPH